MGIGLAYAPIGTSRSLIRRALSSLSPSFLWMTMGYELNLVNLYVRFLDVNAFGRVADTPTLVTLPRYRGS